VDALSSRGFSRIPIIAGLAALAAVAFSQWGCAGSENKPSPMTEDQTPVAAPVEHPLLKGIPIPTGFNIVREHSRARRMGSTRVAQCEFQGSLIPSEVVRFYEHYMPAAHFRLGPKIFVNGEYTLRFESDTEECSVFIKPKLFGTVLILDVGPLSKGEPEPAGRAAPPPP
jgi:hypothetical protein